VPRETETRAAAKEESAGKSAVINSIPRSRVRDDEITLRDHELS
jgi:hypothetical protein